MREHILINGLLICILFCLFSRTYGRVNVRITINSYANVNGTCYQENSSGRKCCDEPQRADCTQGDTCDTYFNICVGSMKSHWGCEGAFVTTPPYNNTNTLSNTTLPDTVSDYWHPGMGIFVFIEDSDLPGVLAFHDHIDTLIQVLKFDPDPSLERSSVHQYEWNGNNVQLRLSVQVWCVDGYYGSDCQKYCQGISPIAVCTASTGDLVCQSKGALLVQFQSAVNNSMFPALDVGVNRFMDEQVCQKNTSNVQYAQIDSTSNTLTFEGFCNNVRVLPVEFESFVLLVPDFELLMYFKPGVARGPFISPQGYGEHIIPNVYIAVQLMDVEHLAGTSYVGNMTSGGRKCCDVPGSTDCDKQADTCDLQFSICIGEISDGVCIGGVAISTVFDNSTSLFTCGPTLLDYTTGQTHVSHPLIGAMRLTRNKYVLQVLVKDVDPGGGGFDTVDIFNSTIAVNPGPNVTAAAVSYISFKNVMTLKLQVVVWCADGHWGPLCSAKNGTDHCEQGWSGDECDIPIDSCHPNPCQNKGTCDVTSSGAYNCTCELGFTGQNCTQDVNECALYQICQNNGTCVNSFGAFNCNCTDGWTGLICSEELPHCNPTPCVNGNCSPVYKPIPGYMCTCNHGWSGRNCDYKDVCSTSTCIHGICTIVDGIDICMCTRGYSGKNCTEDIDECLARPCKNNGNCDNAIGWFNCSCPAGFTGQLCEVLPSTCVQNECQNQGTCMQNGTSSYCTCAEGYTGTLCDQPVNKCVNVICAHGEVCEEKFDDFQCNCSQYFSGKTCDADVNECSMSICQHNAKCVNFDGSFYCECPSGYNGTTCDHDVNECLSSPCHNGICVNNDGSYTCLCQSGFTGKTCETITNYCVETSCSSHGACSDGDHVGICTCDPGWTGVNCNTEIAECGLGVCGSHSTGCVDVAGSYNCTCMQGWQGQNCTQDVNECDSTTTVPCSGNGFCTNKPGTFTCNCLTGFSGTLCDKFTNTCNDIKCFNNATCEIRDDGPTCVCSTGWSGLKCETDVNECETSSPCLNSGTCTNIDGSFLCTCYSGWTGTLCQFDVNECHDVTTCSNNGSCTNVPGTYHCACQDSWQGMSCEVNSPTSLQGNILAFTFQENITSAYQQPMVSYMYHFLTTYVCNRQDVQLLVNSCVANVISITATCGGTTISNVTVIDGISRVPNDTLPRLFPLAYKGVRQKSTFMAPAKPVQQDKTKSLGTPAIVGIVLSSIVIVVITVLSVIYFKRRKAKDGDDIDIPVEPHTPYYKMDEMQH